MNAPTKPVKNQDLAAPAREPAKSAYARTRHFGILVSFFLFVLFPVGAGAFYLWLIAEDQYASTVGFSVRNEQGDQAVELLGGITEFSSSSASDSDILYDFIQSQNMVAQINADIDLNEIWSKPDFDPVFAYQPPGTIEDLLDQWGDMVRLNYDTSDNLLEVRALAFTPEDALKITTAILARSTEMINELSDIAREDTLRYTREDLNDAIEYLKATRQIVTEFRNRNQIVDPESDLQTQATVLGSLQARLADTLIEVELLRGATRENDPRLEQGQRRIEVIRQQIEEERRKLGLGTERGGDEVFATIVGEYERLIVDREIAEQAYAVAFAAHERSRAEARRQTRYLAAHIQPTLAEKSEFPKRWTLFGLLSLFLLTVWSIGVLVFFSVKDRR